MHHARMADRDAYWRSLSGRLGLISLVGLLHIALSAQAGVTIQGTRIIVPSDAQAVSVQIQNQFDTPALIQVWLDTGDMYRLPEASQIPFILTPALTRVDAQSGQAIRIIPLGTPQLPQDRESLFIFNLLDIPPQRLQDQDKNLLSFNVRTRIKLFYRPVNLKMSQDKGFKALKFYYNAQQQRMRVENPTPYYINFSKIIFNPQQQHYLHREALMVHPFDRASFQRVDFNAALTQVKYFVLNDLGGENIYTTAVITDPN